MTRGPAKPKRWEDHYSRRAKKERFPARSVYKLKEIQKKYRLVRKGDHVLDLGCAPGSWLILASELAGPEGRVTGFDVKAVTVPLPGNVAALRQDVLAVEAAPERPEGAEAGFWGPYREAVDVVLSDMAPDTTGSPGVDAARSLRLCRAALAVARIVLVPGGHFVCKIFHGEDFKSFTGEVESVFSTCRVFKPESSRKASKEIYISGMGKRTGGIDVRA